MKSDGVSTAFSIIMEEIGAVAEQLNQEGVNAFKNSKYSDAQKLSESGKELGIFKKKLEALQKEWNAGIDISTRKRVKIEPSYSIPTHSKSAKTNLRITMPSGRVIQRPTAAKALVDAIESLGIEKVNSLGHKVNGVDLISKHKHEKYGQNMCGEYFICTHSSTESKKKLLLKIGEALGEDLEVEIIEKNA
ncbi:conserved hypothetical protein [delta proteobacterium NaphS2]|nr:conserved hypothetical protein [delta proteobacterium NaphS2]